MEINSPFTMVVIIVLIGVAAGVINNWIKVRSEARDHAASDEEVEQMRKDLARLTERVRVLETLATDKDERLREEIRRLA